MNVAALILQARPDALALAMIGFGVGAAIIAFVVFDLARAAADRRARQRRHEFLRELNDVLWGRAAGEGDVRGANVLKFPKHGKGN